MKRTLLIVTTASLVMLLTAPCYGATEITLDPVDGLYGGDTVAVGSTVRFVLKLTYTPGDGSNITGFTNAFQVWTHQNGAYTDNFDLTSFDTLPLSWLEMFDGGIFIIYDPLGGADIVGFGGFAMFEPGIPDGFDLPVWYVETTPYQIGDTLCIDSSFYPPAAAWIWSTNGPLGAFGPDWYGPYCFHVAECCIGIRGNVDGDPNDQITVGDLTYIVDYKYRGGPPPICPDEADVDGDGIQHVSVADLAYMVAFLFRGGPEPPSCP